MNRRVLRNAVITLSVLAAVAAVTTIVRSGPPPSAIARTDQNLSAGVHTLDLVALETAGNGPARLPRISITLPSGWRGHKGFAVLNLRGSKGGAALPYPWAPNVQPYQGNPLNNPTAVAFPKGLPGLKKAASEKVVAYVRVNNERSWPGYGDVSWQPIPPASARSAITERLAQGRPGSAPGCAELGKLKAVFPAARAVGFTQRHQIMVQAARDPVFPGRCGAFWTTYKGRHGKEMDVMVTLYKASKDVRAALAEPAFGEIHRLSNGARVRTGSFHGAVNGTPSLSTNAVSAFRKLFISSTSISTSMTPVAISVQLRIHRHIENAFARLQVTH